MNLTEVIASLRRAASSIETIPSFVGEIDALDVLADAAAKAAELDEYTGPRSLLLYSCRNAIKMVHERKQGPEQYRITAKELVEVSRALVRHPQSTDLVELCVLLLNRQARNAEAEARISEIITSGHRSASEQAATAALAAVAPRLKLTAGGLSFTRTGGDGEEGRLEACITLLSPADPGLYAELVKTAAGLLVDLRRFRLVEMVDVDRGEACTYAFWRWASSDKERHAWRKELERLRAGAAEDRAIQALAAKMEAAAREWVRQGGEYGLTTDEVEELRAETDLSAIGPDGWATACDLAELREPRGNEVLGLVYAKRRP